MGEDGGCCMLGATVLLVRQLMPAQGNWTRDGGLCELEGAVNKWWRFFFFFFLFFFFHSVCLQGCH